MKKFNFYRRPDIVFFRILEKTSVAYREKCLESLQNKQNKKWNNLFKKSDNLVYQIDQNVKMHLYKDSAFCKHMYFNPFEENELFFLKRFLKPGDIFFDIGTNIGLFSLIASSKIKKDGLVYSFEPTPLTYKRFIDNISLNKFDNIIPCQIALSNETGNMDFNISSDGGDVFNSFVKTQELENGAIITVKTTTVDNFIEENNIDVSKVKLVKIDVEGWETNVMKGAKNFLAHPEAPVLMVEFTDSNAIAAGSSCSELYDLIEASGFKWYKYNARKNKLIPEIKKTKYPYDNLIAIKDLNMANSRLNTGN